MGTDDGAVYTDDAGTVHIADPRGLRAISHPARQRALQALYGGREATATELAETCGATAASMSYHLRTLNRWGLILPTSSYDGRERRWRAAGKALSVSPLTVSKADPADAVAYVNSFMAPLSAHAAEYAGSLAVGDERPGHVSRTRAHLSATELRDLTDYLQAFFDSHQDPTAPSPNGEQRHPIDAYLAFLPLGK